MSVVIKAMTFARNKHEGQKDDDGFPYFDTHIHQVVSILSLITNDENILAAAFLHDTLEDTNSTYEELEHEFGKVIADLVMEVTHEGKKDNKGYWFPRLKSKKAILIKFADRLSNLSRMDNWDMERQIHYLKKSKFWKSEP